MQPHCGVIESVSFELADGITESDFLAWAEESHAYLRGCAGFLGRTLGRRTSAPECWLDLVLWEHVSHARAAAERFAASPHTRRFTAALKKGSVAVSHHEVKASAFRAD